VSIDQTLSAGIESHFDKKKTSSASEPYARGGELAANEAFQELLEVGGRFF